VPTAPDIWEAQINAAAVIRGRGCWQSPVEASFHRTSRAYNRTPSEALSRRIASIENLGEFAPSLNSALWSDWFVPLQESAALALADSRTISVLKRSSIGSTASSVQAIPNENSAARISAGCWQMTCQPR
jgi:hypothetical protein